MHPIIARTFGGLTLQYYIRQFLFGAMFAAVFLIKMNSGDRSLPIFVTIFIVINTLLYPYARFVYESTIDYIMGDNIFILNAVFMLFVKFMTMALCWSAAVLIAPFGLLYLYFKSGKSQN
jgi:hypothetical protein